MNERDSTECLKTLQTVFDFWATSVEDCQYFNLENKRRDRNFTIEI